MDFESTAPNGVETETGQEVVEPATDETGSNEQEVAEPASESERPIQDSETNAAFQRMRHEREQMQSDLADARAELEQLKAQQEARENAIARMTGNENGEIAALAELTGLSEDEIAADFEAAKESAQKDARIQQLEEQLGDIMVDKAMQEDLAEIQKIDPSIRHLDDLGPAYADYIAAGLPPVRAYWAIKAEQGANRRTPPKEVGKVATGTAEKDYFTEAEIDAMSPDQRRKNYKKIIASWDRNNS